MAPRVLFLCTGNYYRSRFAEALFAARAKASGLDWQADSRALGTEPETRNPGPISRNTLRALAERGLATVEPPRGPLEVTRADLVGAALVVALDEEEHRPMLAARFPGWELRVEYWNVADLPAPPAAALSEIERRVTELVARLARR